MIQNLQDHTWLRRTIFLVVNLLAGVAVVVCVVIPVRDLFADRDARIAEQRATLARLQAIALQAPAVESIANQAAVDRGEFLSGQNEGIINADLQTRLKGMAESASAHVRSIRNLPPRTADQVRYIGSHIEFFGSIQALQRAIHTIESAKPYLFVTNAIIRPSQLPGRSDIPQEPVIEAQLDVFGAMQISGRDR